MKLDVATWCQNAWQDSQRISRPVWLQKKQQQSLAHFIAQGLPTRHQENWKYSELSKHFQQAYQMTMPQSEEIAIKNPGFDCYPIVLNNGCFHNHQQSAMNQLPS